MKEYQNKITALLTSLVFFSVSVKAQVPVSQEPMHHNVLQNKYFRLLDVWLQPGDTTQYHIHATPSLFVILSQTVTAWQTKGEAWVKDTSPKGRTWYRSFLPDTLVHRVCNMDTVAFHVNDIEILSAYQIAQDQTILPFEVLFDNDKATAYRVTNISAAQKIKDRGPMIAELVTGNPVYFNNIISGEKKEIFQGKYLYVLPGTEFYFTSAGDKIDMVLFEIK